GGREGQHHRRQLEPADHQRSEQEAVERVPTQSPGNRYDGLALAAVAGDQDDGRDVEEEHLGQESGSVALEIRNQEAGNQEEGIRQKRVFERKVSVRDLARERLGGVVVIV